MKTPEPALNALVDPHPVTLGQIALLEKIGSPLVVGSEGEVPAADLIPSLYLLTLPSREGVAHLTTLEADAFAWADGLTAAQFQEYLRTAMEGVKAFYELLPQPEADAKKA